MANSLKESREHAAHTYPVQETSWWSGSIRPRTMTPQKAVSEQMSKASKPGAAGKKNGAVAAKRVATPWRAPKSGGYQFDRARSEPKQAPRGPAGTSTAAIHGAA